jgi:uncharacterized protein (TIGR04255 family)
MIGILSQQPDASYPGEPHRHGPASVRFFTRDVEISIGFGDDECAMEPLQRAPVKRPYDLPEFGKPPLNEVVLGVQFDPPSGYQQIMAGDVWRLFSADFPEVQELPPLPPIFETFGPQAPLFSFGPITGPMHNRFWFTSKTGSEIIQFQNDRLLHNWRKVGDRSNKYPRFDTIVAKFLNEMRSLEAFFDRISPQPMRIRQCELSYVNHIKGDFTEQMQVSDWLNFLLFSTLEPDDFAVSFRQTMRSQNGDRKGRLTCEASTAVEPNGRHFISLTLTARGVPEQPSIDSALDFLTRGRDLIVRTFAKVTTDLAHKTWERAA